MRKIITTFLILLIFVNFLYVFSGALNLGLRSYDAYTIWVYKGKSLFLYEENLLKVINSDEFLANHKHYPIFLPYFFVFLFKIFNSSSDLVILLIYPYIYLLILFLNYKNFRTINISRNFSLLVIYIMSMMGPMLAQGGREHAGNADIILTLLYSIFLYVFLNIKNKNYLAVILVVLIIISSMIKLEGLFLVSFLLFLPIKLKNKMFFMLFSLIPFVFWQLFVKYFGITANFGYVLYNPIQILSRSVQLLGQVVMEMIKLSNWYIFWPIFWILIIFKKNKYLKTSFYLSLILIIFLFASAYIFSTIEIQKYAYSSLDRIMLQLLPFIFIIFADRLNEDSKRENF